MSTDVNSPESPVTAPTLPLRHGALIDLLRQWADPDSASRLELYSRGLRTLGLGDAHRIGTASIRLRTPAPGAPKVAVIGSHRLDDLAPNSAAPPTSGNLFVHGPGVASRVGSMLAFLEGARAAAAEHSTPVDLTMLSVGTGDTLDSLANAENLGSPDVIVFTDALNWNAAQPTNTIGCRGRLEATITITAAGSVSDVAYAGASLNPLNRLVEVLAALRGSGGRVGLPGFYDRATPPERGLLADVLDDEWLGRVGASRPGGSLPAIERATQWPLLSVLSIDAERQPGIAPATATAEIAFSLVPDQRPVDVERALRAWLVEQMPESLNLAMHVRQSARPYLIDGETPAAKAMQAALAAVHLARPVAVPAGGTVGAGEVHFRFGAPIVFAGLGGPDQGWGSQVETLPAALFDDAVAVADAFCRRLNAK